MKLKPYFALLALPLAVANAWADDATTPSSFTLSGFGTIAGTEANNSNAEFSRPNQKSGTSNNFDFGVDSDFGVQGTEKFNDMLSLTAQGLFRRNGTEDFGGQLAWAFAKFKINDSWSIRVGRVGLPVYMISDYRNVGYANNMIRPPVEMYTQVPVESVDGADVIYQTSVGDTTFTAQVAAGTSKTKNSGGFDVKFKDLTAINLVAETGPMTFRFGRVDTKVTVDDLTSLNQLTGALSQYGFVSQANSLAIDDTKGSFTSFGMTFDYKNFVGQAELAKRKTDTLSIPDTTSWYTMLGYRVGNFLPFYNHAFARQDGPKTVAGLPTTGPLAALTAGANQLAHGSPDQSSNSIGVRWDAYKNIAVKVQLDRFSPKDGPGTFTHATPGFTGPVTVIAAGVDFVF